MYRDEKLELRVGLFIGVGMFLMFMIVFSIQDVSMLGNGYGFNVKFDYVNGLTENSPVRLAGVNVGEVKHMDIVYDENLQKTRVSVNVWIKDGVKIEKDAVARVNTLGLLGEQYLEISPGTLDAYITQGEEIEGHNPLNVGEQMEKMNSFLVSLSGIVNKVSKGEGTLGKFIMDDTIYDDLSVIFGRLKDGQGTIGKLLVEETIYNDMESFVADIKAHPWKLLSKPRRTRKKEDNSEDREIGFQ